jgi:hypothetical protein
MRRLASLSNVQFYLIVTPASPLAAQLLGCLHIAHPLQKPCLSSVRNRLRAFSLRKLLASRPAHSWQVSGHKARIYFLHWHGAGIEWPQHYRRLHLFAGQNASFSYATVPAVLLAPAPLAARQWSKLFWIGKIVGPSLAVVGSVSAAYLAYKGM